MKYNYTNPITGATRGAVESEPDPFGTDAGLTEPLEVGDDNPISGLLYPSRYADILNGSGGCVIDGSPTSCDLYSSESMKQCPQNNCGPRVFLWRGQKVLSSPFRSNSNGRSGFMVPDWGRKDVKVEGEETDYGPDEIIGWDFADASVSDEKQIRRKPILDAGIPTNLRDLVVGISNRDACKDALEKMYKALGAIDKVYTNENGETLMGDLFDRIKEFKLDSRIASGGRAEGEGNKRLISIRPIAPTMKNPETIKSYYASLTIQELLHHSSDKGNFDDDDIDQAAVSILKWTKDQFNAYKKDPANRVKEKNIMFGTVYQKGNLGHSLTKPHCQYTQAEVDKK